MISIDDVNESKRDRSEHACKAYTYGCLFAKCQQVTIITQTTTTNPSNCQSDNNESSAIVHKMFTHNLTAFNSSDQDNDDDAIFTRSLLLCISFANGRTKRHQNERIFRSLNCVEWKTRFFFLSLFVAVCAVCTQVHRDVKRKNLRRFTRAHAREP